DDRGADRTCERHLYSAYDRPRLEGRRDLGTRVSHRGPPLWRDRCVQRKLRNRPAGARTVLDPAGGRYSPNRDRHLVPVHETAADEARATEWTFRFHHHITVDTDEPDHSAVVYGGARRSSPG